MTTIMPMKTSGFPSTSRYFQIELGQFQPAPDVPALVYVRRRFLPSPSRFTTIGTYTVKQGDRLDNITANFLADPEQFWRLCDANNALAPSDLTATVGRVLNITLPEGISGPPLA
jgi:hypothetical protein